jgi:hypothetical protein
VAEGPLWRKQFAVLAGVLAGVLVVALGVTEALPFSSRASGST